MEGLVSYELAMEGWCPRCVGALYRDAGALGVAMVTSLLLAETPYYSLQREGRGSLELTFPPAGAQGPGARGQGALFYAYPCLFVWSC